MINQVRFSNSVKFFERDFCNYWNVTTYKNNTDPCLFAGVYNKEDVELINNHKGFKVVWNNGNIRPFFIELNPENMVVLKYTESIDHSLLERRYKIKKARFPIKDYTLFTPTNLGDKICCYLGTPEMRDIYGYSVIHKLEDMTRFKIIISYLGKSREDLKRDIYDKSFVYFKPIIIGGVETANELAHMGRKTISNAKGEFYIPYQSLEEACTLI